MSHSQPEIPPIEGLLQAERPDPDIFQDQPQNWTERLVPGFLAVLRGIGIDYQPHIPSLNFKDLTAAHEHNPSELQKIKKNYLGDLIQARSHRGIGTPLKAMVQYLLQPSNGNIETLGDPNTWVLDPLDSESCLAVVKLLLEIQQKTNIWIGFAKPEDWTDPWSTKKNQRPPLLGHEPDPIYGRRNPIRSLQDFQDYLLIAREIVKQERIDQLSLKLARAHNSQFDSLLTQEKQQLIQNQTNEASRLIEQVYSKTMRWRELNELLAKLNQPPLEKYDHSLIKIFPQDNPAYQNGDIMLTESGIEIEFSEHQFTHRGTETKPQKARLTLMLSPSGQLIIIGDQQHLPYLYPIIQSRHLLELLDKKVLPKFTSSYYEIEIMLELGLPTHDINPSNLESAMRGGKIAFVVDMIAGKHQLCPNGQTKTPSPSLTPYLVHLNSDTLINSCTILPSSVRDMIETHNYLPSLYQLLNNCQADPSKLTQQDVDNAKALLAFKDQWVNQFPLPPSLLSTLKEIITYGRPLSNPWRSIVILEQRLKI